MHKIKQPLINCRGQCCQRFHYLTAISALKYCNGNAKKLACQHIENKIQQNEDPYPLLVNVAVVWLLCHTNGQCAIVKAEICVRGNKLAQYDSVKIGSYISPSKARVSPACLKNRSLGTIPHGKINELTTKLLFVNPHINAIALLGSPSCW